MANFCRSVFALTVLMVVVAAAARVATAQGTHLWKQSTFDQLEKGSVEGVALTSDGHLREGPGLTSLVTTPSTFVWSVAVDKNGTAYLGTQAPATVLRVSAQAGEKPFTLFSTKDVSAQVVRLGPDGSLYVATMPSGKVYKLNPEATARQDDASATVVFDMSKLPAAEGGADKQSKTHYIWDMTFDKEGRLYIATGDPAAVFRVDVAKPGAQPEEFFKSDEAHIRSLAWDGKGNLIAGSAGSGLVYRISPAGKGYVIFDSPKGEITSLAVTPDGTIYAAGVGEKGHNPLPPLPVQGMATVTISIVQPGSMQAANASTTVPEGTEIYALNEGEAPRTLWSSKDDVVYALVMRPDGLLAVSGNQGHVYLIHADGSYADIGHLDAQQGLCVAQRPGAQGEVLIGTGNTGKVFLLGKTEKHEYASDVLDAGAVARFGRVEIEPGSANYQILTRSGNIDQPVRGWTDWVALKDGVVASPPGRFLQWKAVLQTGGVLGSVGVNYLPVRSAPVVDQLVVVPGARLNQQNVSSGPQTVNISFPSSGQGDVTIDDSSSPLSAIKDRTAVTVRWSAHDEDGDKMSYSLYLRGDGETQWWPLKKDIRDTAYSFDATQVPDGGYRVKVVASDAPSEPPGEAVTGFKISDRFVIDTTPPVLSAVSAAAEAAGCSHAPCAEQVRVVFDATDATSPIARASYSVDAGPWQFVAPVGGLSDSKHEHYDFVVPASALDANVSEHLITVRAYDRYDNVGLAKSVFETQAKQDGNEKK